MKALFELFRRFDARRIFGFIRRLGGMSRPKVKCYDLRSTHALRVEGDLNISDLQMSYITFLSTPSGWRATKLSLRHGVPLLEFLSTPSGWRATNSRALTLVLCYNFYPRPPGGGRRRASLRGCFDGVDFYPRPPGGGRPASSPKVPRSLAFLSTPSGWRATARELSRHLYRDISIHALRVEGDASGPHSHTPFGLFLSTPSGWRATA